MIREIQSEKITDMVASLCIEANITIGEDICKAIDHALDIEESEEGISVLADLKENIKIASNTKIPICQDTGMAVVFIQLGQDVHIAGEDLEKAVSDGVSKGYKKGFLRASVVKDPFNRVNTKDNTPAVIHVQIVPGNKINITLAPKGFGSENMSSLKMLMPSEGIEGVKKFVLDTVLAAGANACPPLVIGVGVGGTMEKAAIIAKQALLRPVGIHNFQEHIADIEKNLLEMVNKTGIGPGGLGGKNTALAVNMEVYPTHIAGLPVAVNIGCHATRHATGII